MCVNGYIVQVVMFVVVVVGLVLNEIILRLRSRKLIRVGGGIKFRGSWKIECRYLERTEIRRMEGMGGFEGYKRCRARH